MGEALTIAVLGIVDTLIESAFRIASQANLTPEQIDRSYQEKRVKFYATGRPKPPPE